VREHSVDRVLREIEKQMYWVGKRGFLSFLDDIFNLKPTRMKQILRGMIDNHLTPGWVCQVRHEAAHDRELLELMRESNCRRVFVGLESVNPRTLERYGKRQTIEGISRAIRAFQGSGIKVHGLFVLGSDDDSLETFEQTLKFSQEHDLDSIQLNTLTPLPGSRDFCQMSEEGGRLLPLPWNFYDCCHVVHVPKLISPADLQAESIRTMGRFYSLKAVGQRLIRGDLCEAVVRLYCYGRMRRAPREMDPYIRWLKDPLGPAPEPAWSVPFNAHELLSGGSKGKDRNSWLRCFDSWLAEHFSVEFSRFLHLPSGWPWRRRFRSSRLLETAASSNNKGCGAAADSAVEGAEDSVETELQAQSTSRLA